MRATMNKNMRSKKEVVVEDNSNNLSELEMDVYQTALVEALRAANTVDPVELPAEIKSEAEVEEFKEWLDDTNIPEPGEVNIGTVIEDKVPSGKYQLFAPERPDVEPTYAMLSPDDITEGVELAERLLGSLMSDEDSEELQGIYMEQIHGRGEIFLPANPAMALGNTRLEMKPETSKAEYENQVAAEMERFEDKKKPYLRSQADGLLKTLKNAN